jgi:PAS domain S-box-containing protein
MTMPPVADSTAWSGFRPPSDDDEMNLATADTTEILDAVSVPIVILRRDFIVARFNSAAADTLGLAAAHIGHSPHAISILSEWKNLERWCAESISTGTATQHDIRVADRSFVVRIAPYSNARISGTVLTFNNVTAFRASIDQAVYEREYAKAILNTVADALVVLDANLQVLTANRAFYSMFRLSREAIHGVPLNVLGDGILDLAPMLTQLKRTLADDQDFPSFEIDCEWPAAGRRTMSLQARQFALPGRSPNMVLLSLHDITSRKKAEATNTRLAAIVESSDDAILTNDIDGIITSWNGAAQRIFGYAAEEIIGKPITLLIPADRQHEEAGILERVKRGERIQPYDTVRQRKSGSLVDIFVTISALRDAAGKIAGVSKIARDITDRKKAEEAQRLLAHEVDHRSKNLLTLVQAAVHFSEAETPDAIKAAIEGRIQALANVHTLLAQSRWAGVNLRSIVRDELYPYCPLGNSRAETDGPDLLLKPQLAQLVAMVLHELATNAVKYGALSVSAGRLRVEWWHAANGNIAIRWTETGGPPVKSPARRGFGSRMLDRAIRTQLNGDLRFNWRTEGLICEIEVPYQEISYEAAPQAICAP